MKIRMRPFEDCDHDASARVFSKIFPDFPVTAKDSRRVDEGRRNRFGAVAQIRGTDRAVGFGEIWQDPLMNHPGKYWMWVMVDPECQLKGIGSAIYDHLMEKLCDLNARTIWTNARDDLIHHLEFIRHRGFRELWWNVTQRLTVEEADLASIADAEHQMRQLGISIVTLDEEAATNSDYLRELHRLHNQINEDVPRAGYFTPPSFDEFATDFARGTHLPDAYFLAKIGDEYIGLSYLQKTDGNLCTLEVGLTGVRREYRRQGIAKTLKLRTLKYARQHGFLAIETGSDSTNEAILDLNESVGFRKTYAWVTFEKQLC